MEPGATICDGLESEEAVEFSFRSLTSNDTSWIPIQCNSYVNSVNSNSTMSIRGYDVPLYSSTSFVVTEEVFICGDLFTDEAQFRWMASVSATTYHDIWAIAEVSAVLFMENGCQAEIFHYNSSSE